MLIIYFLLIAYSYGEIFELETYQIESTRERLIREGKLEEFVEQMENETLAFRNEYYAKKKKVLVQHLYNYFDVQYIANISLGTPGQHFRVIPDTSNSEFWVFDKSCLKKKSKKSECRGKDTFDSKKSSTYKNKKRKFERRYDAGYARGIIGEDTLQFLGRKRSKLRLKKIEFIQMREFPFYDLRNPFEGILGLGFRPLSRNDITPPLIAAVHRKILKKPLFTVHLRELEGRQGVHGGKFTYGAINKDNCGPVIGYQKLSSLSYWQYKIKGIGVKNKMFNGQYEVFSDTANSIIGAPPPIVEGVAQQLNAQYVPQYGLFVVPCNTQFGGFIIKHSKFDLKIRSKHMLGNINSKLCVLKMYPYRSNGYGATFSLGDPLHMSYCVIYDIGNKRIGFARPKP